MKDRRGRIRKSLEGKRGRMKDRRGRIRESLEEKKREFDRKE